MHSAKGVEQQLAEGSDLVTADALVDSVAAAHAATLNGNSNGNGAYVNGNGNGNGAANGAANGTVPASELIQAAAGLRQVASAALKR